MRVFLTGATGFIGRALVPLLQREGHTVVVWTRSVARARARLGADIDAVDAASGEPGLTAAIDGCDAVINLAGEPVLPGRWTTARRRALRDSRVGLTEALVRAIAAAPRRPRVLVSSSAVGFYGDRGEELLTEASAPGDGFLAQLCEQWEAAACQAERHDVRVVLVRTGVVLGRDGGALARMLPPFRLGLGGPIGSGRQYVPWIHLHDLAAIFVAALTDERFRGPINAVAPNAVTSREFAGALGKALGRPALLPVPGLALRALFGEAAGVLLASQRVEPAALRAHGFAFAFPAIAPAVADLLSGTPIAIGPVSALPESGATGPGRDYLRRRKPAYALRTSMMVKAPIEEAFSFFSKAENLGLLTPSGMGFSISGRVPDIHEGTTIDYRLRVGAVPIAWRSRIVDWRPGERFVDQQERGPYRSWYHEHSFRAVGSSTLMQDCVYYAPPLSLLGRLANRLFIVPTLQRIFRYRADVIRLRFGAA
jgi:uncharacterized protein (TIGR01777 family)